MENFPPFLKILTDKPTDRRTDRWAHREVLLPTDIIPDIPNLGVEPIALVLGRLENVKQLLLPVRVIRAAPVLLLHLQ